MATKINPLTGLPDPTSIAEQPTAQPETWNSQTPEELLYGGNPVNDPAQLQMLQQGPGPAMPAYLSMLNQIDPNALSGSSHALEVDPNVVNQMFRPQ